ncbi:thioredoxin family protein [Desulfonatronum lacustre]|uniref:thioredoxin family protein n=1 Tax=Desulfonatronum lacustre TaxID=66849 RepID=UPI00048BF22D|nr:thioredoxin family protein [Desulfonatronum lacustre]SMP44814.1 small redox-active disulfide protein 2 [Desulfonatronum zhilinae]
MKIKVLGPGCAKCSEVERIVREAVAESGKAVEVEKITDMQEFMKYGVFSTPAVIVDDQVKAVGKVPGKKDVLAWING